MKKIIKFLLLCLVIVYFWGWRDAKRHAERVKNGDKTFDVRNFVK